MLEEARPDLVTTSLPNEEHFAPTLELIRHGVPLLVEKPLVFSVAEADQLLAEAAERGLFFAINFNHRYAEAVQRAHAAIEAGELGEIVHVTWRFGGEANPGQSPHRNLIETQCHGFDMLEHLAGPISSVMAQMTNKTDETVYNTMAIAVSFANRARRQPGGQLRLVLRLSRHAVHRGQRHPRARADPRHRPGADPLHRRRRDAPGVAARVLQRRPTARSPTPSTATSRTCWPRCAPAQPPPIHARAGRRARGAGEASVRSFEDGVRVDDLTAPGAPRRQASIRDVAELAGVSPGTASKALNHRGSLRPQTDPAGDRRQRATRLSAQRARARDLRPPELHRWAGHHRQLRPFQRPGDGRRRGRAGLGRAVGDHVRQPRRPRP